MDTYSKTIFFVVWIALIWIQKSFAENVCNGKTNCPTHKRFCTPVGCVFECPKDLYVNRSTCVLSCEDWFSTADKICQQNCPENFYVRENVKLIGKDLYLEKQCVSSCAKSEYTFNGTCLRACPAEFPYAYKSECVENCSLEFYVREYSTVVLHEEYRHKQCIESCDPSEFIFNNTCIKACPHGLRHIHQQHCAAHCPFKYPFMQELTLNGVLYNNCVEKCLLMVQNNVCVEQCSEGYLYFKSSCLTSCPDSHPLVNQWGDCDDKCNSGTVALNGACKNKCSKELPFIYNMTCMNKCPQEASFLNILEDGSKVCVESCSSKLYAYSSHMSCLHDCPEFTLKYTDDQDNNICVSECPSNAPLMCDSVCYETLYGMVSTSGICVTRCPVSFPLINNNTCVNKCPSMSLNKTCVAYCPTEFPYAKNITECSKSIYGFCTEFIGYYECGEECEQEHFLIKETHTCVEICPTDMVTFNNTCLHSCPTEIPFQKEVVVTYKSFTFRPKGILNGKTVFEKTEIQHTVYSFHCREECKNGEAKLNFTCVDVCPTSIKEKAFYYYNGSCFEKCPDDHKYIGNKTINESCTSPSRCKNIKWHYECLKTCPKDNFIQGNYCVNYCPRNLSENDRMCIKTCPAQLFELIYNQSFVAWVLKKKFHPWEEEYYERTEMKQPMQKCVSFCENSVQYGTSCKQSCPLEYKFISDNVCHNQTCITKYEHNSSFGIECLTQCPVDTFVYNNLCVNSCPLRMVSHASVCLKSCPFSEPVVYDIEHKKNHWAFSNDGEWRSVSMVTQDKICCRKCPKGVMFNMTCIDQCPSSYKFIFNGECKSYCQEGYVLLLQYTDIQVYQCLPQCPNEYVLGKNRTCTKRCPIQMKYNYNGVCLAQCPHAKPFGANIKTWSSDIDEFKCISECEGRQLFKPDEEKCVYSLDCEQPYFAFQGQCLTRCPPGFRGFLPCFNALSALLFACIIFVFFVLCIIRFKCIAKESFGFLREVYSVQKSKDDLTEQYKSVFAVEFKEPEELEDGKTR